MLSHPSGVRAGCGLGRKERAVRRRGQGEKEGRRSMEGVEGMAGGEEREGLVGLGPPARSLQGSAGTRSQHHLQKGTSSGWTLTEVQFLLSSCLNPFAAKHSLLSS